MGIIDKCGVRGDATLCVVIFYLRIVYLKKIQTSLVYPDSNYKNDIIFMLQ